MVSGGLREQIEAALLTEKQLCSVWQDTSPEQDDPGDPDVPSSQRSGPRLDKTTRGTLPERTR